MTREEAIKDIEECVIPYVGGISLRMAVEDMKEMDRLSKSEPVLKKPDRPHGEWISRRNRFGKHLYSVCSECNVAHNYTDFPNFCPNCGSDNRKKEGEAE